MLGKCRNRTRSTASVLLPVLLVLSFTGLAVVVAGLLIRVRALATEVADLEGELAKAELQGAKPPGEDVLPKFPVELNPKRSPEPPPKPERSLAEREAINALALICAITDLASEKAFFTGYDVYEMNGMVLEVEGNLRKIIQERPPYDKPSNYWRIRQDEDFKRSRSEYREKLKKSLRQHSLQPEAGPTTLP